MRKEAVDIPIIASLNGVSLGGWTQYAKEIQSAGADAIELNIYYIPANKDQTSGQVEDNFRHPQGRQGKRHHPGGHELSPFFSSMANMLWRLDQAGADARCSSTGSSSRPGPRTARCRASPRPLRRDALRLPLRWIAILHGQLRASLAGTTGIYTGLDAAKMIAAGADIAMVCSALLKNGVPYMRKIVASSKISCTTRNMSRYARCAVSEPKILPRPHSLRNRQLPPHAGATSARRRLWSKNRTAEQ